jgi:ABC-type multidrug transport system fused ATPase/permease subunit
MAAFLPLILTVMYLLQRFYLRTSRQMRLLDIEHRAPVYTNLAETIEGLMTLRAFSWSERAMEDHLSILDDSRRPTYSLGTIQSWLNFSLDLTLALLATIFVVIATTLRSQIGARSTGTGLSGILAYSNVVQQFISQWTQFEIALGAVARIKYFVTHTKAEAEFEGEQVHINPEKWPATGTIEVKNITASYVYVLNPERICHWHTDLTNWQFDRHMSRKCVVFC